MGKITVGGFVNQLIKQFWPSYVLLQQLQPLLFVCLVILHAFLLSADLFQNQLFRKILSGIPSVCQAVRIQIRRFVGPDLGPNCLLRLSADNTSGQRV